LDEKLSGRSEGQKEQIKLRATYLNGLAIGLVLVGGISLPTTIAFNARSPSELLIAGSLFLFSFVVSPYIHWIATKVLGGLDR
jgi:hypothetical protein